MEESEPDPDFTLDEYDPQEDDPKLGPIIRAAEKKADANLVDHPMRGGMGYCYAIWEEQKRILKEDHRIDWKPPNEMNPWIMYD